MCLRLRLTVFMWSVYASSFYYFALLVFFFFQAEDGIRDLTVTGVQTCALPIYLHHREGPDDHDPRLHPGPEPAGRAAQGPSPGPGGRAEHRADLARRRQGDRAGAAGAEGQAGRVRAAGTGTDRVGGRPHLHRRSGDNGRGDQPGDEGGVGGRAQGHPDLHRGPDRVHRHRHRPGVVHLRLRADQGDRQPGEGRRLVRQRVGLLQPARRHRRPGGRVAVRTLDDLLREGVTGRRVLVRAHLNGPLDGTRVTHDGRIRAVLPTLTRLRDGGAHVVVMSHLGRPKGGPDPKYSLAAVATRLGELLGSPVAFSGDTCGAAARSTVEHMGPGHVALLENLRFNPGETSKDDAERADFATRLAEFGEAYVDDAFGAVHRRHASVYELARLLPRYAGGLVLRELEVLGRLTGEPARPYGVVLGGSKGSDKLAVIQALLPQVDALLVGGAMRFTVL